MVSSIMGISPAALLRWQPEQSEVSLSLFVSWQNCQQINTVPPRIIQLSMNKSGGTILNYSLFYIFLSIFIILS